MEGFAKQLEHVVKTIKAARLVIDPLTSAVFHQPFRDKKRMEIGRLFRTLRKFSCTSLVTSEVTSTHGEFYMEEYLADGVIELSKTLRDFRLIKTLRVEKMRGVKHDDQPRKYEIKDNGFEVYSTETITI